MHKIGILGAAGIAPRSIIQPARRQGETIIHAVASRRPGAAQVYADTHRIPVAYSSYDALLADPEITIVYNALPPTGHAEWTIKALEAGKHVLCEKPLATSAAEAAEMVGAAQRCFSPRPFTTATIRSSFICWTSSTAAPSEPSSRCKPASTSIFPLIQNRSATTRARAAVR